MGYGSKFQQAAAIKMMKKKRMRLAIDPGTGAVPYGATKKKRTPVTAEGGSKMKKSGGKEAERSDL